MADTVPGSCKMLKFPRLDDVPCEEGMVEGLATALEVDGYARAARLAIGDWRLAQWRMVMMLLLIAGVADD